jgi:hypothetical protein
LKPSWSEIKRFIAEYLKDNNATQPLSVRAIVTKLRSPTPNESVAQAIAQQQKASIVRTLGSADEVLEQMWRWPPSMPISYRNIAAVVAVTAGASATSINGATRSSEERLEALERKRCEPLDVGGYGYNHLLILIQIARAVMAKG